MKPVNDSQGDREGRPIRINRRPSPSTSVGARAVDEGLGGPLGSPASCSSDSNLAGTRPPPHPAGDPKGPPNPSSSTLAPTDHLALCLASRLQLTARTTLACSHSRSALCCQVRVY